jgi:hypothetical protein
LELGSIGIRSEMISTRLSRGGTLHAVAAVLMAGLAALPCRAACCDGPNTLFQWNSSKAKDSKEKDSDDNSGNESPFSQPLSADRPGFGDSPTTVGCGVYQLELGYQYTFDHQGNTTIIDHSYPQALLRIGTIANWFEARISWSMEQETDRVVGVSSETNVGADDMNVGFKIALTDQDGCRPQMGIVADMFLPTGSAAFTAGEVLPEIEWIYQWSLTKKFSITGINFFSRELDSVTNQPFLEFSQGIMGTYQFTEPLGGYVEWNISTPDGADTDQTLQVFQGGFTLLVNYNLQLDAEAGVGLNKATPDYFIGTGLAKRW